MVKQIVEIIPRNMYKDLDSVSDGICANNTKDYVDFDNLVDYLHSQKIVKGDTLSSCDTLLLNTDKNHLIFVEFKNMNLLDEEDKVTQWWSGKNRSVYLKITDSILVFSYYLNKKFNKTYNEFMNISKSFFYVYKSDSYRKNIHNHLKYKFSRYNFLFENIRVIETKQFEQFLTEEQM